MRALRADDRLRIFVVPAACVLAVMTTAGALTGSAASGAIHRVQQKRGPIEIQTTPAVAGLQFGFRGRTLVTNSNGVLVIPGDLAPGAPDTREFWVTSLTLRPVPTRTGIRYRIGRVYVRASARRGAVDRIRLAVDAYVPVRFTFVNRFGRPIDLSLLDSMTIKRIDGGVFRLGRKQLRLAAHSFQASRVVPLSGALVSRALDYRIQSVVVAGNSVVNRAQQAFTPLRVRHVTVRLLFYSALVSARDTLFGFGIGSRVRIVFPDGLVEQRRFLSGHRRLLRALPRGTYHISVDAWGLSGSQPLSLTRDQVVELKVLSYLDIAVIVGAILGLAVGLVAIGRRRGEARTVSSGVPVPVAAAGPAVVAARAPARGAIPSPPAEAAPRRPAPAAGNPAATRKPVRRSGLALVGLWGATVRAIQAEQAGDHAQAATLYADAANRWEQFTGVLEQAHALLGQGRCLTILADPHADQPLRQARHLFEQMGARPRIQECDSLIAKASKLSS